jgi:hypothetical protein
LDIFYVSVILSYSFLFIFNVAEFIEEERTGIKIEIKVEGRVNPEDIILIDTQNKLRDEEIESSKKSCQ